MADTHLGGLGAFAGTIATTDKIAVDEAGTAKAPALSKVIGDLELVIKTAAINAQTGTTYTLALTDSAEPVTMDNASPNTVTIPTNAAVAFPVGTVINIVQIGAGVTSIAGDTGVTLNGVSAGSGDIQDQFQGVSLLKIATDTWVGSGSIGAVA